MPEFAFVHDMNILDPLYCTQQSTPLGGANNAEFLAESANPVAAHNASTHVVQTMPTDMGATVKASTHPAAATETDEHTLLDTNTAGGTGGTVGNSLAGLVGENDDEAWSQPKEPYVGMRFDTLEGAKEHYNAYALQLGFSIKMNTIRRTGDTRMLVKQQFVCNKFRKPTEDDGGAEKPPVLDKIIDKAEHVDEDDDIVFLDDESKLKKKSKKRKRDKIIQTGCKAKMVVKLVDGRWEVVYYVGEHNHKLVDKPSLKKYLRSHQGIPPEERAFLTHLHNCNLTTGEK